MREIKSDSAIRTIQLYADGFISKKKLCEDLALALNITCYTYLGYVRIVFLATSLGWLLTKLFQ